MRVIDIENITEAMRDDTRFVLRCEEVFHDKISAAAASILMNKSQKPLVCLTGPSGSGKTTTEPRPAHRLHPPPVRRRGGRAAHL